MLEELRELLEVPGVSGFEAPIRERIESKARWYARTEVDRIGNLYASIGGEERSIAVIAHMDENGMVVTKLEDDGTLRFRVIGGIDDRCLVGRVVNIYASKGMVKGVIGLLPPHLMVRPEQEMAKVLKAEDLRIDLGCSSAEEARGLGIDLATPVVFEKQPTALQNGIFSARGLDNRMGCTVLLEVLRRLHQRRLNSHVEFVWSVQEEIGLRGATVVSMTRSPDFAIIVDTCSATDIPGVPGHFSQLKVGGGPVIRFIDNRAIATPAFVDCVKKVAAGHGIPVQIGISGGSTDGAAAQTTGAAMVPLGVAIRYTHAPVECISLEDLENLARLLEALLLEMDQGGMDAKKA